MIGMSNDQEFLKNDYSLEFWKNISQKGYQKLFVSQYHSIGKILRGLFGCFRKFLHSKNFIHKGGIRNFEQHYFLSHSAEKNDSDHLVFLEAYGLENFCT